METDRSRTIAFGSIGAVVGLVLGFLVGLIVAWVYWSRSKEEHEAGEPRWAGAERLTLELERPTVPPGEALGPVGGPDDLTIIEGVGPRISGVLNAAGITTFEQLGERKPDELTTILREEDPRLARIADPTTWPEQAILAAAGAWDALEDLQEMLKGGRRV